MRGSSLLRRARHRCVEQLGGELGGLHRTIAEAGHVAGCGRRAGMANVPGDVSDVGAGGVERRHDRAAARMRAKARRIDPDLFRGTSQQLVDLLPSDEAAIGLGEHWIDDDRFVGVGLPQRPGRQTLLRLSLPPRSQPFDRAGGEVVHTRGASGLRRAKRSALSTVDDRPADARSPGLEVDVGPRQAENLAHSQADREQDGHHGAVAVPIGLVDQAGNLFRSQHPPG